MEKKIAVPENVLRNTNEQLQNSFSPRTDRKTLTDADTDEDAGKDTATEYHRSVTIEQR